MCVCARARVHACYCIYAFGGEIECPNSYNPDMMSYLDTGFQTQATAGCGYVACGHSPDTAVWKEVVTEGLGPAML